MDVIFYINNLKFMFIYTYLCIFHNKKQNDQSWSLFQKQLNDTKPCYDKRHWCWLAISSMSLICFGHFLLSTTGPFTVIKTSSSILIPIPLYCLGSEVFLEFTYIPVTNKNCELNDLLDHCTKRANMLTEHSQPLFICSINKRET